jgi:hypothetical protein
MRADQLQVAVRPRTTLECLDLAFLFCGRRPLAVATAIAIGAAPFIVLNRLLFGGLVADDMLLPALYVLGIEAAWASVPLTLYLGQAVFANRFSWRMAAGSLLGSLPALLLFQGFLRSICIVILFLSPVVIVGMYYLNQVILLEQPKLSRIWSRRGGMNQRLSGHILATVCMDAVLMAIGVPVVTGMLGALSSVWQGRPIRWLPTSADGALIPALFSWHGQIAFWSVCGLLTVFRFFTYLDARIRREGWDVELKLRSAATYAGLPEPPTSHTRSSHMAGAAGLLLALLTAGLTAAAARATDGDAASGSGAKRALTRQSFPWYDAAQDSYRPLIQPGREASESASSSSTRSADGKPRRHTGGTGRGYGSGTGDGSGSGASRPSFTIPWSFSAPAFNLAGLGQVLMIGLFVIAGLVIIYLAVRYGLLRRPRSDTADDEGDAVDECDEDRLAALPDGARLAGSDLLARAAACADEGDFAKAIVFYHAWQLLELDRRGGLVLARGKTNGQYTREVATNSPTLADVFRRSSRLFEDAFFGDLPVAGHEFQRVWDERGQIASFAQTQVHGSPPAGRSGSFSHTTRGLLLAAATMLAASAGCQREIDTDYAAVRGQSINGITAFLQLLRDTGHSVTARQFLPATVDPEFTSVVVFDDSFTGLPPETAAMLSRFRQEDDRRTVLLVLRDSDCIVDYLRAILARDDLTADQRAKAGELLVMNEAVLLAATSVKRLATPPFPDSLAVTKRLPAAEALEVRVRQRAGTSEHKIKARWELHRQLDSKAFSRTLWSAGSDRLLIQQKTGDGATLVLASAAPLLNGGLVDPGSRLLAEDLASLLPTDGKLLVAGSSSSADSGSRDGGGDGDGDDEEDQPSPWRLLGVQPLPWVAAQAMVAMALFCWCTSPIFGRAKQSSPQHSQDFGHHVAALASLMAKSPSAGCEFARARLEAWRATVTTHPRTRTNTP